MIDLINQGELIFFFCWTWSANILDWSNSLLVQKGYGERPVVREKCFGGQIQILGLKWGKIDSSFPSRSILKIFLGGGGGGKRLCLGALPLQQPPLPWFQASSEYVLCSSQLLSNKRNFKLTTIFSSVPYKTSNIFLLLSPKDFFQLSRFTWSSSSSNSKYVCVVLTPHFLRIHSQTYQRTLKAFLMGRIYHPDFIWLFCALLQSFFFKSSRLLNKDSEEDSQNRAYYYG